MKINVNNINLNYEVVGKGKPIILLHGNSESHKIFKKLILKLQDQYQVYALDSRCHGKSDNPKTISYELMAEDTVSFIKKLKLQKPILYGFSDGGIIGLLIALKEKSILSKLIISGVNLNPEGFTNGIHKIFKIGYALTHNKRILMMLNEPNIDVSELKNIKTSTHLLVGKKDIVKFEHTKLIAKAIPNCTLEVIENGTHSNYVLNNKKLYFILKKYL